MKKYYERKTFEWGDELDGKTLTEAKVFITKLIKQYSPDAKLALEYDWDSVGFYIEYERSETAEEKADRLLKESKQERADRTRYEKLKAKYGW